MFAMQRLKRTCSRCTSEGKDAELMLEITWHFFKDPKQFTHGSPPVSFFSKCNKNQNWIVFCAPLRTHSLYADWKGFTTQGTVLCKLMTKNVQERSKSGSGSKRGGRKIRTAHPRRVRLADLHPVFRVLATILEDGSDERQQKESRIKSHMLSCILACSKGHT